MCLQNKKDEVIDLSEPTLAEEWTMKMKISYLELSAVSLQFHYKAVSLHISIANLFSLSFNYI